MGYKKLRQRVASITASLVVAAAQLSPMAAIFISRTSPASAVQSCIIDQQGVNDATAQADMSRMCYDDVNAPTSVSTTWNWDKRDYTGANTGDACALMDTDNNGFADYAVCVTISGAPATQKAGSPRIYQCDDTKLDRCNKLANPTFPLPSIATTCTVAQTATDPFPTGEVSTTDTTATCTIVLSDVGGSVAKLLDVCSFNSQEPNSNPVDCVVIKPSAGKLQVNKVLNPSTDGGLFNLQIDGATAGTGANVGNNGTTGEIVVNAGTHSVGETGTNLANYTSSIECRNQNGTGTVIATSTTPGPLNVSVSDATDVVCTITNTLKAAQLQVVKNVINDNGGTKTYADFSFTVNSGSENLFDNAGNGEDGTKTISLPVGTTYSIAEPQANTAGYTTTYDNCSNLTLSVSQTTVCTITNNDVAPQLTIIKDVIADNGSDAVAADFSLAVSATNPSQSQVVGSETGTTITLNAGSYSVTEPTSPAFDTTYSSACSGTIGVGEQKTCTVSNDDKPGTLVVRKELVQDNGGAENIYDFEFAVNGGAYQAFEDDGESEITVDAGFYDVEEKSYYAYATTYDNCTDVFIPNGGSATCTVTNNDIAPKLTVTKIVNNNYGGTLQVQDFTLYVDADVVVSGQQNEYQEGVVTVSEESVAGYIGTIGGDCGTDGSIAMSLGMVYNCTITNADQPAKLRIVKEISNDNGGDKTFEDFSYTVNGNEYGGSFDADGIIEIEVPAGIYTVVEPEANQNGYQTSYQNCSQIVLTIGSTATCTVRNEDIPAKIIVQKQLIQDNGGNKLPEDFSFSFDGNNYSFESDASNEFNVDAGTYSVVEATAIGYEISYNNCSNIAVGIGQTATCVVTNNDIAPSLTLVKSVANNNGGQRVASEWTLSANGPTALSGAGGATSGAMFKTGVYTLEESGPTDYTASDWTCTNGVTVDEDKITLALGQQTTCSIINDDKEPQLVLNKVLVTNDGGNESEADWVLIATGPTSFSGPGAGGSSDVDSDVLLKRFDAGVYTLSESAAITGYTASSWVCDGEATESNQITIGLGQTVNCTVTNDDKAPILTLEKIVEDEFNGGNEANDWTLYAAPNNDAPTISGSGDIEDLLAIVDREAYANTTYTLSESGPSGYDSEWVCSGSGYELDGNELTMYEGADVYCAVTNTALAPSLILEKRVIRNDGGVLTADEWMLEAQSVGALNPEIAEYGSIVEDSAGLIAQTDVAFLDANTRYKLSESGPEGYSTEGWSCSDDVSVDEDGYIELSLDQDVVCTITNDDIAPRLTLKKNVVEDEALPGNFTPEDWQLVAYPDNESDEVISGYGGVSNAQAKANQTYYLYESYNPYFEAGSWSCSGNGDYTIEGYMLVMSEGSIVSCEITNTAITSEITVHKYFDYDRDGSYDVQETVLQGFNMLVEGGCLRYTESRSSSNMDECVRNDYQGVTNEEGVVTFSARIDDYMLEEQLTEEQIADGWVQTGIHCYVDGQEIGGMDGGYYFGNYAFNEGDEIRSKFSPVDVDCYVGNNRTVTVMQEITKTNDAQETNDTRQVGETVTYEIVVENSDENGTINNPVVVDTPPEDFTYFPGSWTANSNIRGNLRSSAIATAPDYASPGRWRFNGSAEQNYFLPGERITLTYQAVIGDTITEGDYPDVAYLYGEGLVNDDMEIVFGNIAPTNMNGDPFVASVVTVVAPKKPLSAGVVLSARTTTLQKTGIAVSVQVLMGFMVVVVVASISLGAKKSRVMLLLLSVGFSGMLLLSAPSSSALDATPRYWTVNISSPNLQTNENEFVINYQTSSTVSTDSYTVSLYQNGKKIESEIVSANNKGGDAGQFAVNVQDEGKYDYVIKATNAADNSVKNTNEVSIFYDKTVPSIALYSGAQRTGNTYKLNFSTESGDAVKAIVYSSKQTSFVASTATQVGTIVLNGAGNYSFTYTANDNDQRYFAVSVVDTAANVSAIKADETVQVRTVLANGQNQTNARPDDGSVSQGTSNSNSGGEVLAENDTDSSDNDAQVGVQEGLPEGAVEAGSSTSTDESDQTVEWLVGIGLIAAALYLLRKSRRQQ